jgi:hypothetical protein
MMLCSEKSFVLSNISTKNFPENTKKNRWDIAEAMCESGHSTIRRKGAIWKSSSTFKIARKRMAGECAIIVEFFGVCPI